MDTIECIKTRRSVRKYKSNPVSKEDLNKVLEAVRWAPSWANTQCWELVVIDDPEVKKQLQETLPPGNPSYSAVVDASYVIAVCGKKGLSGYKKGEPMSVYGDWMMFDLGIATQNLCLTAWSLGLGTVHIGFFDHKKAKEVLGLPEDVEVVELIPLGYPDHEPKAPPRKSLSDFVHWNRFGNKKEL